MEPNGKLPTKASSSPAEADFLSLVALAQSLSVDPDSTDEAYRAYEDAFAYIENPPPRALRRAYAHYSAGFAAICEAMGLPERAETLYESGLAAFPQCPMCLGNYALFLQKVKRPVDEVEAAYVRALTSHPRLVPVMIKYSESTSFHLVTRSALAGSFLRQCQKSTRRAEAVLTQAILYEPKDADVLSSFAVFLHAVRPDDERIEDLYARAERADPTNVDNLSNSGLYALEITGDAAKARKIFNRALGIDPTHANTCYNFAVLLESADSDVSGAVAMYERAIAAQPNHAYALYNLAVLAEEKLNDFERAKNLYRDAVQACPEDAQANADRGRFLIAYEMKTRKSGTRDFSEASTLLRHALTLDNACATAHAALGEIAFISDNIPRAKSCLRSALNADPKNAATIRLEATLRSRQI